MASDITLPVPGLRKPLRLCLVTDTHLADPGGLTGDRGVCCAERSDYLSLPDVHGPDSARLAHSALAQSRNDADVVLWAGDIIDFPSPAALDHALRLRNAVRCPLLAVPGNHDWAFADEPSLSALRDTALSRLAPLHYTHPHGTLEVDGVRFFGLDSSCYAITPDQLEAFRAELAKPGPLVLLTHLPLDAPTTRAATVRRWGAPIVLGAEVPAETRAAWGIDAPTPCAPELVRLARNAPNLPLVLAGHVHFPHTERLSPHTLQIVGAPGYTGAVTRITLEPAGR